jgi:hypothetical protein
MRIAWSRMPRGAVAGAIAAAVWALQQPLDKRTLGCAYDDVELLGRMVLPAGDARRVRAVGFALHKANGALFGAVYAGVLAPGPLATVPAPLRGPLVAQAENFALWPLGRLSDRFHPARERLPRLAGSRRALAQATWRHLLFGVVLGELERRWNRAR